MASRGSSRAIFFSEKKKKNSIGPSEVTTWLAKKNQKASFMT